MKLQLPLLLTAASLTASEISRVEYLELIKNHPEVVQPLGSASKGEIEIVLDPELMASIEQKSGRDVGVLKSNQSWIWLNDACLLPDGTVSVMGRIVAKSLQSRPGVGVLPVMPDGKVAINCQFRHATRSWELEMPRGGVKKGESFEQAARRELLEETGCIADQLIHIGEAAGDSGVTGMILPLFIARIKETALPEKESTEVIDQILILSIQEVKEAFVRGYVECVIGGEKKRVHARDPFLSYALTIYSETL